MKISEVIKSLSASNAAIKNTASSEPKEGWYPAYSASGQDVWLPDCRFTQKGIVVSAVGARCGKAFKADGKWNICANTHPLSVDETKALRDYCWYMINNEDWWIKGGTAQPFVKVKDSFNRDFNFPPISEQKMIVSRLDTIQALINQKQLQIKRLDELVKARFVEMFNSETKRELLQNLSIGKSGYGAASASVPYNPNRPRYIRITDINDDGTLNNDYVCSINKSDDGVFRLQKGDFLFARMGATVGKTYYYRGGNQIFAGYLIRFKLDLEKILPEYLYAYTQTEEYLDWVKLNQSGAAQPGINAQKYSSLQIPIADIAEQTEFVYFVKQIDKSKFVLSNELTMCDFHIRLIHDRVMHSCINLRVAQ